VLRAAGRLATAALASGWLAGCSPDGMAGAQPQLMRLGDDWVLRMPSAMGEALRDFDPVFVPLRTADYAPAVLAMAETPFAVIGDFNGDGKPDLALYGRSRGRRRLLAVMSEGASYTVVLLLEVLPRRGQMETTALIRARPGRYVAARAGAPPLVLTTDAFKVVLVHEAAYLQYWHEGEFHQFFTAE